jgi:hypothetical protein
LIAWLATWLWQGLTLTLLVTLALRVGRVNAASRYMLWWATLAGVLVLAWTGRGHISAHETAPFAADDVPMGSAAAIYPIDACVDRGRRVDRSDVDVSRQDCRRAGRAVASQVAHPRLPQ